MEERPFGKTGEKFSILSFGAQRIVDDHGCSEKEAIEIMNHALDNGIRYFDTAWLYSNGQSEERVGKVAQQRREEMWIATKALARDRDGARNQLEESLKRLQIDYVDEWRMHTVDSRQELDRITAAGGALEAAVQARDEGLVRHISISGHMPHIQIEALKRFAFDSVLCTTSVLDHFIFSFVEEFLPLANAKSIAVIGMKVLGLSRLAHIYDRALRYAFALPVSTVIVGMETMEQLKKNPGTISTNLTMEYQKYSGKDAAGDFLGFPTPSKRVEIYSTTFKEYGYDPLPTWKEPATQLGSQKNLAERYPFILTVGKVAEYCHSQLRALPSLRKRVPHPFLEINPQNARELGLKDEDRVRVETVHGSITLQAKLTEGIQYNVVCTQNGWWQACHELNLPAHDPYSIEGANVNLLCSPKEIDPISGSIHLKGYPCNLRRL